MFLKFSKMFQRALCPLRNAPRSNDWPKPEGEPLLSDPLFLFIFTPPHSGSTALAQVLNSAPGTTFLEERAEGQWLVPGMCESPRWNPARFIDWNSVRAVWMAQLRHVESLVGRREVVIEKSPPNLVRVDALLETFPHHEVVVFNRNPFAFCASVLYRNYDVRKLPAAGRAAILRREIQSWISCSAILRKHAEALRSIRFSYEEFCANPDRWIDLLAERIPILGAARTDQAVAVKDYQPQPIVDQNRRQIGKLLPEERELIGKELGLHEDLARFFGYTSDWNKPIELGGAQA